MKIILEIKETATLARIEELSQMLNALPDTQKFRDVIQSIKKEW